MSLSCAVALCAGLLAGQTPGEPTPNEPSPTAGSTLAPELRELSPAPGAPAVAPEPEAPPEVSSEEVEQERRRLREVTDDTRPEELAGLSLKDLLDLEISVASRINQTARRSPAPAVVFTREEIMRMGIRTLEELLNYVPGFSVTVDNTQNQLNSISVRGTKDFLSKGVLFLLDGEPVNDVFSGSAVAINRWMPLENVAQVEIIRGPGSALYGSNALSAVVNIVTVSQVNGANVRVGSTNSQSLAVNLSQSVGDLRVVGFAKGFVDKGYEFENYRDGVGQTRTMRDPMRGFDLSLRLTYGDTSLTLRHSDRTAEDFVGYNASATENRAHFQQSHARIQHDLSLLDGGLKLRFKAGYTVEQLDTIALVLPAGTPLAPGFNLPESYHGGPVAHMHTARGNVEATWSLLPENTLVGGIAYSYSFLSELFSRHDHNPITLAYVGGLRQDFMGAELWNDPDAVRHLFSLYLQDQHEFGEYVTVTAGGRLDYYSDVGAAVVPRVVAVGHLPIESELKLIYGRAFRAPNFYELYDRNNPIDYGNPDLNPETIQTFEAVYEQRIGNVFAASVAAFHNDYKNLIRPGTERPMTPDNPLLGFQFVNQGRIKTKGLEVEARAEPFSRFLLRAAFTHLFDADELRFPANSASAIVGYFSEYGGLTVNGIYQEGLKGTPQDDYVVVNSSLQARPIRGLSVNFSLLNLFDERYDTLSTYNLPDGLPNRGRTFYVELVATL